MLKIIGASVLAIGIWTKVQLSQYLELTELYYEQAPYIMIGVGALILLVAIGGFFCTAKDKIALLYMVGVCSVKSENYQVRDANQAGSRGLEPCGYYK